jgi:hypothetical protein
MPHFKSAMLFSNFDLSPQQSANYYHLGLATCKRKYSSGYGILWKAKSVNTQLGITDYDELLQLQNGLLYIRPVII